MSFVYGSPEDARGYEQVGLEEQVTRNVQDIALSDVIHSLEQNEHVDVRVFVSGPPGVGAEEAHVTRARAEVFAQAAPKVANDPLHLERDASG
jgi:hypothetical protein